MPSLTTIQSYARITEVRFQRARAQEARAQAELGKRREALEAHERQPDPVSAVEGQPVKAAWLETIVSSRTVQHRERTGLERAVSDAHVEAETARVARRETGRAWARTERYLQIERTTRATELERSDELTQDDFSQHRHQAPRRTSS